MSEVRHVVEVIAEQHGEIENPWLWRMDEELRKQLVSFRNFENSKSEYVFRVEPLLVEQFPIGFDYTYIGCTWHGSEDIDIYAMKDREREGASIKQGVGLVTLVEYLKVEFKKGASK
jgi:hypothetical protein